MNEIERIIALSNAFGPSGFEDEVTSLVREEIAGLHDIKEDTLRNIRGIVNPENNGPKVMLESHLDEVGIIVQAVKPNGTMTFLPIGGQVAANFPNTAYQVRAKDGSKVKAIVTAKPPHFMSAAEKEKAPAVADMVLDCGSVDKAATENDFQLGIACPGVPDIQCTYNEMKHLFYGKAFDCRIGVAAEIEALKRLQGEELPCQVQGAFSSQEEVGERGVVANYNDYKPDVMICFEGCPADDTFQESWLIQAGMYKGPMLRHFDVSMITNPRFQKFALDLAHEKGIPVQESVRSGGGTDAGMIHKFDVPCIVIGVPVRYIHSSNCYCTLDDYQAAVDLAVELCRHLDQETVASF